MENATKSQVKKRKGIKLKKGLIGKCACFDGYNGELCNISRCSNNDCSGRGQCNLKTGIFKNIYYIFKIISI